MRMLSHKNTRRLCMLSTACVTFLSPLSALAAEATANEIMSDIVVQVLTFINIATWALFAVLTFLLDPAFIFNIGSNGGSTFMDMLNEIWQLARDLVNLVFAVVLVAGAIYTIATASKELLSQYARDFVLALILVNFSWFIPRVVLDVANVSTAAIFGIPSLIGSGTGGATACEYTSSERQEFCTPQGDHFKCSCVVITNVRMFVEDYEALDGTGGWNCPANELLCYQSERLTPGTVAGYSAILNGLIINHGRLRELGHVPPNLAGADNISAIMVHAIRQLFILSLHLALFLPLLAMCVAFFIRIPVLWITIAFMPFAALKYVGLNEIAQDYPSKIWKTFVKAAFLPAMVAIPLAIGFIMINAGARLESPAQALQMSIFPGVSNLWQLIWMLMSFGVLWVGVFEVLSSTNAGIMGAGTQFIKGAGESLAKNTLRSVPVPLPGGTTSNLGQIKDKIARAGGAAPAAAAGAGGAGTPPPAGGADKAAKAWAKDAAALDKLNKSIDELRQKVKFSDANASKAAEIKAINNGQNAVGTADPVADLKELLKKLKAEGADAAKTTAIEGSIQKLEEQIRAKSTATAPVTFASTSGTGTGVPALNLPANLGMPPVGPADPTAGATVTG